jgi:hypothetical protein
MPLVLTVSAETASGHNYRDELWVAHEYPQRYRNLVIPGEVFVYYRGRYRGKTHDPIRLPDSHYLAYLGVGVIGEISVSPGSNLLLCEIRSPIEFASPVGFKREDGSYIEPGGDVRGHFQPGVRAIDQSVFTEIVTRAELRSPAFDPLEHQAGSGLYANPDVARAIEDYSRAQTIRRLASDHPGIDIEEMAYNNPGFDLKTNVSGLEFVEVKGTQADTPRFFMSEVERSWWNQNQSRYAVYTVYGIELSARRHVGIRRFSDAPDTYEWLKPHKWFGVASQHDGIELDN